MIVTTLPCLIPLTTLSPLSNPLGEFMYGRVYWKILQSANNDNIPPELHYRKPREAGYGNSGAKVNKKRLSARHSMPPTYQGQLTYWINLDKMAIELFIDYLTECWLMDSRSINYFLFSSGSFSCNKICVGVFFCFQNVSFNSYIKYFY